MTVKVLGLCGSLRRHSYNRSALLAVAELVPAHMQLQVGDYADVPLFNQDVQDEGFPAGVLRIAEAIRAADALVIASPEYNFSVSGVLKNLIDWLSRVPEAPLKGKPVAILSATMGPLGGARHQYELRKILGGQEAFVLPKPEVFITACHTKFDSEGRLTDEATRQLIVAQMLAFDRMVERFSG